MILLQLCRIYRRAADVNSIPVLCWDIRWQDVGLWVRGSLGPLLNNADFLIGQTVELVEVMFCLCLVANLTPNTSQVVLIHSDIVQQPLQGVVNLCNNV